MKENLFAEKSIRTVSGKYVNVFDPTLGMIEIFDIAHALSHQCRFGGHLPRFYSVAQHSIMCSFQASNKEDKLAALMHDASEAYLLDIPRPIKSGLTNYKEIEDKLMKVIAQKFNFQYPLSQNIKDIDNNMLVLEWNELMLKRGEDTNISCQPPLDARSAFIDTFNMLKAL